MSVLVHVLGVGAHTKFDPDDDNTATVTLGISPHTDVNSDSVARRVILHEFGHVLGFKHDHSRSGMGFRDELVIHHFR